MEHLDKVLDNYISNNFEFIYEKKDKILLLIFS